MRRDHSLLHSSALADPPSPILTYRSSSTYPFIYMYYSFPDPLLLSSAHSIAYPPSRWVLRLQIGSLKTLSDSYARMPS